MLSNYNILKKSSWISLPSAVILSIGTASASPIFWTDWTSGTTNQVNGTITTTTSTVDVTYDNPQGIAFLQTGGGTDYFKSFEDQSVSPYTSAAVDNTPTASEMIGLRYSGNQSLSFSESVSNLVFSYVSLNGNGYSFNQDFNILSVGGVGGKNCGYWGCGTSYKNVVDLGGGNFEYQLLGTGEPHGTIQFLGAFNSVSWNSLSNEYWNGFTVGVQGTTEEVDPQSVSTPATMTLMSLAMIAMFGLRRKIVSSDK